MTREQTVRLVVLSEILQMIKKSISILLCLISSLNLFAQKEPTVSDKDLRLLIGNWQGTITYLDYTSNKPFSMPAELEIRQDAKPGTYLFAHTYPNEPKANETDTITIARNKRLINRELVISKRRLTDGSMQLVTEYLATDGNDNKPAIIRHTYTIGKNAYTNRKEVKFALQDDWTKRSEYAFIRKDQAK